MFVAALIALTFGYKLFHLASHRWIWGIKKKRTENSKRKGSFERRGERGACVQNRTRLKGMVKNFYRVLLFFLRGLRNKLFSLPPLYIQFSAHSALGDVRPHIIRIWDRGLLGALHISRPGTGIDAKTSTRPIYCYYFFRFRPGLCRKSIKPDTFFKTCRYSVTNITLQLKCV